VKEGKDEESLKRSCAAEDEGFEMDHERFLGSVSTSPALSL
jgi:hypothetical protein